MRNDNYNFIVWSQASNDDGGGPYQPLGELDIYNDPSWNSAINQPGTMNGTVAFPMRGLRNRASKLADIANMLDVNSGRYLIVDLNGIPVWGGLLTGVTKKQGVPSQGTPPSVDITANEPLNYPNQRCIRKNYLVPIVDAFTLIGQILADMQSVVGGSLGIPNVFPSDANGNGGGWGGTSEPDGGWTSEDYQTCGLGITQQYFAYEFTTVGQILDDITGSDGLIEVTTTLNYVNGVPQFLVALGCPAVGNPLGVVWPDSSLDIDMTKCPAPGYQWPLDITQGGNRSIELGFGEGANQLWAYAEIPYGDGYSGFLLEQVQDHTEMLTGPMLQSVAQADLRLDFKGVLTPSVPLLCTPLSGSPMPSLIDLIQAGGGSALGNEVRCMVDDDECFPHSQQTDGDGNSSSGNPGGLHAVMRIVNLAVTAPDKGGSIATLTLNRPYTSFGASWTKGVESGNGTEGGFSVIGI